MVAKAPPLCDDLLAVFRAGQASFGSKPAFPESHTVPSDLALHCKECQVFLACRSLLCLTAQQHMWRAIQVLVDARQTLTCT